ncbi:dipeptide ABC transporter ATP-binding protein [Pseudonocardia halophobica]|uniref:Peptide ABC transporter ATP-binding protein n=1 Tax=Pseudonocardia halophobica TaxID=29401 RepID=A0A9W6L1M4_9PSEU|nr:oligopeptide/dipeptide ABC transporter ATP-binding protein [Pseudonocardia halophobica]GLL10579.1 peptide ABC transporter ATP-binding protein [Pseudonocardia halophobica]
MTEPTSDTLLEVSGLTKHFPVRGGVLQRTKARVRAVDGLDFTVRRGETLGLVGESGSGKSTTGRLVLRLIEPTAGRVVFDGVDVLKLGRGAMRDMRSRMQMIFQDPYSSLDPQATVADSIGEPLSVHEGLRGAKRDGRVVELLERVGLKPQHLHRYPYEFSGGQRQRICIARALALKPDLLVCDEPVSALDVSIQAQVINLLKSIQRDTGISLLFISHDLSVVRHVSDRIAVMYLGRIVEIGDSEQIYTQPRHPYTETLLSAIPVPNPVTQRRRERILLRGEPPSPLDPPSGCRFHTRCQYAMDVCAVEEPVLAPAGRGSSACHLHDYGPGLGGGTVLDLEPTHRPVPA